jgi:hypothetical protein
MFGWITDAVAWLAGILSAVGDALVVALKWFATHAWTVLRWTGEHLGDLASKAWHGLTKFWTEILPEFAKKIEKIATTVTSFLKDHFGWLIDAISKITKAIRFVYNDILKPIFQIIDFLRVTFRILGDLGVGWAKKVDTWLGNLEQKIWGAFELATRWINHTLGLFAYLLDPFGMIRRGHLFGPLGKDLAHLISLFPHTQPKSHLGTQSDIPIAQRASLQVRVSAFNANGLQDDPAVMAGVAAFEKYSKEARA